MIHLCEMSDDADAADARVLGVWKRQQKARLRLKIKGKIQRHFLFDPRKTGSLSVNSLFLSCFFSKSNTQVESLVLRMPRGHRHKRWKRQVHTSGSVSALLAFASQQHRDQRAIALGCS